VGEFEGYQGANSQLGILTQILTPFFYATLMDFSSRAASRFRQVDSMKSSNGQ
jgi:hypothetical protein